MKFLEPISTMNMSIKDRFALTQKLRQLAEKELPASVPSPLPRPTENKTGKRNTITKNSEEDNHNNSINTPDEQFEGLAETELFNGIPIQAT